MPKPPPPASPTFTRRSTAPEGACRKGMLILRIIGVLVAIAIGAGIASYLLTGDKRYLRLAGRLTKYALIATLAILSLMFLERVIAL